MPYFTPDDLDIDVDDFLDCCNSRDIEKLIEYLIYQGHISEEQLEVDDSRVTLLEYEFNNVITKIVDNRLRLTAEEDALLKKIADRF
jgi:hypothetical protein